MRFRLDGSRSKLAHRGIVFLLNDGFQIMEILDYRSVANRYIFGQTFGFYLGFELRCHSQTQFDCESVVILSEYWICRQLQWSYHYYIYAIEDDINMLIGADSNNRTNKLVVVNLVKLRRKNYDCSTVLQLIIKTNVVK